MSDMKFIPIYKEQFRSFRRLGPLRLGQLMMAYLDYAENGCTQQALDESQQILLDVLGDKLDRDSQAYDRKCARLRQNGQNGGRPRKNQQVSAKPNGLHENQMHATNPIQSNPIQSNPIQSTPSLTNAQAASISQDHDTILNAAVQAGFGGMQAIMPTMIDLYGEYGLQAVMNGIRACVENGVVKLAYLKKVLFNISHGIGKQQAGSGYRKVTAENNYTQREYEASTGMPDWMREMMEQEEMQNAGAGDTGAAHQQGQAKTEP